jgi:hypothetical protein
MMAYMDDIIILAPSYQDTVCDTSTIRQVLETLSWKINFKKSSGSLSTPCPLQHSRCHLGRHTTSATTLTIFSTWPAASALSQSVGWLQWWARGRPHQGHPACQAPPQECVPQHHQESELVQLNSTLTRHLIQPGGMAPQPQDVDGKNCNTPTTQHST